LNICQIYILLLGNKYSSWAEEEFLKQWKAGIPVRVYRLQSDLPVRATEAARQRKFLKSIKGRGIRVNGYDHPYPPTSTSTKLLQDIDTDLAIWIQQAAHDFVRIRRIIKR